MTLCSYTGKKKNKKNSKKYYVKHFSQVCKSVCALPGIINLSFQAITLLFPKLLLYSDALVASPLWFQCFVNCCFTLLKELVCVSFMLWFMDG
jgi:hypothetical protein